MHPRMEISLPRSPSSQSSPHFGLGEEGMYLLVPVLLQDTWLSRRCSSLRGTFHYTLQITRQCSMYFSSLGGCSCPRFPILRAICLACVWLTRNVVIAVNRDIGGRRVYVLYSSTLFLFWQVRGLTGQPQFIEPMENWYVLHASPLGCMEWCPR